MTPVSKPRQSDWLRRKNENESQLDLQKLKQKSRECSLLLNEDIFTGRNLGARLSQEFTFNCFSTNPADNSRFSSDVKLESGVSSLNYEQCANLHGNTDSPANEPDNIIEGNASEEKRVENNIISEVNSKESPVDGATNNTNASYQRTIEKSLFESPAKCSTFSPGVKVITASINNLIISSPASPDMKPGSGSQRTDYHVMRRLCIGSKFGESASYIKQEAGFMKDEHHMVIKKEPNSEKVKTPLWYNSLMNDDIITGKNLGIQLASLSPNLRGVKRKRRSVSLSPSTSANNRDKEPAHSPGKKTISVRNESLVNGATKENRRSKRSRKSTVHKNCKLVCCHTPEKPPIKKLSLKRLSSTNSTWKNVSQISSPANKSSPRSSSPTKRRKSVLGDWGVQYNTFLQCLLNSSPLEQFHTMKLTTPTKRNISLMDDFYIGRISQVFNQDAVMPKLLLFPPNFI